MIRVGFFISATSNGWTGGANYLLNLLNVMADSERVLPVLITARSTPIEHVGDLTKVEVVYSELLDPTSPWTLLRRTCEKLYGRAFTLESLLRRHEIAVLSHSGHLGPRATVPTIGWIPDFQHRRIPGFFSAKEARDRDRVFGNLLANCTRVVVSSEDARADLQAFRPDALEKVRVFHFVSGLLSNDVETAREELFTRYGINGPYFFLPNQFWAHKNHATVIDALGLLRQHGRPVTVLATGNTRDYRHPEHFQSLERRIRDRGVDDDIRVLGLVPLSDVAGLMRHAVATINPSLFEGWSTTVEEAKTMGKIVIASDIPVHREQAPEHGIFFSPKDPSDLAEKLLSVSDAYDENAEVRRQQRAAAELPRRIREFRAHFEDIVFDASR